MKKYFDTMIVSKKRTVIFLPQSLYSVVLLLLWVGASNSLHAQTAALDLSGTWRFQTDPGDSGIEEAWFNTTLKENITLPGSMLTNGKGDEVTLATQWTGSIYDSSFYYNPQWAKYRQPGNIKFPFWLTPLKHYVGAAWYQKTISVPANWRGKRVILFLERAHTETRLWVNGKEAGMQNSLAAPHEYDISQWVQAGANNITLRVDNRIGKINVGPDSHSITDHTQGNWNGIIGKLQLQATEKIFIRDVQVYPETDSRTAKVKLVLDNQSDQDFSGALWAHARGSYLRQKHASAVIKEQVRVKARQADSIVLNLPMGEGMLTWSEFTPALYQLSIRLQQKEQNLSEVTTDFGMRNVSIKGRQIYINEKPVSLRGTLNNCEFPLTGYPSTDIKEWERILNVIKSYGLNHVRFHSWCPPEAAFVAADKLGVYLQPEAPSWPNHGTSIGKGLPVDQYLYDETEKIIRKYGNHPSFIMYAAGNEPAGRQVPYLNAFVDFWKEKDSRRIYTGMSVGGSWPVIPQAQYHVRGGVRGLSWDKSRPESGSDYSQGIAAFQEPFIAHEMGQWCVFPDFEEIKAYTGSYRAKNFELFRENLQDMGLGAQAQKFLMASGRLQALCYKHEIEKTLRTPGYGGFQLLGLQDFPGQGTALVGVVNAFWKPKPYISAREFSRFCNTVVPLAALPKFVYGNSETLTAKILVANAMPETKQPMVFLWTIKGEKGRLYAQGKIKQDTTEFGNGQQVGSISMPLAAISQPEKLKLEVSVEGTAYANDWSIWVYPDREALVPNEVYYTTRLDQQARAILEKGGSVFFNASAQVVKGKEVAMYFQPVFWNTSWFQMKPPHVTGMYIQSESAAFQQFPTDFFSDLQWWEIAHKSQVMILEDFPPGLQPLVQPIDTWFLNRRLALLFEVQIGRGKLLVSSANLAPTLGAGQPAARQLFASLMSYMSSAQFKPATTVNWETVADLLQTPSRVKFQTHTSGSPDELRPNVGNQ